MSVYRQLLFSPPLHSTVNTVRCDKLFSGIAVSFFSLSSIPNVDRRQSVVATGREDKYMHKDSNCCRPVRSLIIHRRRWKTQWRGHTVCWCRPKCFLSALGIHNTHRGGGREKASEQTRSEVNKGGRIDYANCIYFYFKADTREHRDLVFVGARMK